MKSYLLLVGVLVTNLTLANASGILGTKTQENSPPKKAPPSSKNLHPYIYDSEDYDGSSIFGFTVHYLGGAYGPTNMPIATDGISTTASRNIKKGSVINVDLNWSSGIDVNAFFSKDATDGPLFIVGYRYILGTNQSGGVTHPSSTTPSMLSTFPINIEWSESSRVYTANGTYNNSGAQTGTLLIGRSLLQKGSTSLFIASGLSVDYINHQLTIDYNHADVIFADSGLYKISQTEHRISGGPEIRFIARKSFGSFFGADTMIGSYAHLAYYSNNSEETQTNTAKTVKYLYRTQGDLIRAIPGIEVSLGGHYTYQIKNNKTLTFSAAWESGFEPSGTLLTSPSVGTSAFKPNLMGYALLRIGGSYAF